MGRTSSWKGSVIPQGPKDAPDSPNPSSAQVLGDWSLFQFLGIQAPVTLWTTDRDLRLTAVWGGLKLIPSELIGKTLCDHCSTENSVTARLPDYFQALQGRTVNFYIDYPRRSFHVTLAPLRNEGSARVVGIIGAAMDVTEQRRSESEIRHIAEHDALTNLLNYRVLLANLDNELRRSDRTERPFSVLLLDVDELKAINDQHGHLVGSRVLCRMAATLRRVCRSIDTTARYGGDEFAVLLLETDRAAAESVAQRVINDLANDCESPSFTASVGIAVFPDDGYTAENLLSAADRNLYRNKLHTVLQNQRTVGHALSVGTIVLPRGAERRRSERRALDVPIVVCGDSESKGAFSEETFTISVNAHGALVVLSAQVALGQKLLLRIPDTRREVEARVVRFGPPFGGLARVGVEFARPAPDFWPA
jgi:diguanylate cyclase (GGDEF)-like protein